jgi:uncharacterized protein YndB with AHSA1/START domain
MVRSAMKTMHFHVVINKPREVVWTKMIDPEGFRYWTTAFKEGSHYVGSWSKGSTIRFLDPEKNGMVAEIAACDPYEFISIRNVGNVVNGVDDTESEEVQSWAPGFENYTFVEIPEGTDLIVDADIPDAWADMMTEAWPRALQALKELAERD